MAKFHSLKISEIKRETSDTVSVLFDVPEALADDYKFTQGQYLTFKKEINGEEIRRSYSICSGVNDGELRVAIKEVPGGRFSTFANRELKEGDNLEVMVPMGRFFTELNPNQSKNYVAFTAGSGITPALSLIKSTLDIEPESTFTLFYVNKGFASIIFREELEDLKDTNIGRLRIFHLLTREPSEVQILKGRVDEKKCTELCEAFLNVDQVDEFFTCGPADMIFAVKDSLTAQGVESKKIHFELFTSPADLKKQQDSVKEAEAENTEMNSVEIVLDGNRIEFPLAENGINILDAALERGADLPFACKGGVCCTCRARVTEGEVDMDLNYSLEPEELERGFILTCQAHPKTKKVVVDFDQQ